MLSFIHLKRHYIINIYLEVLQRKKEQNMYREGYNLNRVKVEN